MLRLSYDQHVGLPRALFQIFIQPIARFVNLARSQDPLVIKNSNTSGKRTWLIKVLALQDENLVLIPRTRIEKLGLMVHTCNLRGVKTRRFLGLIGQVAMETTPFVCKERVPQMYGLLKTCIC